MVYVFVGKIIVDFKMFSNVVFVLILKGSNLIVCVVVGIVSDKVSYELFLFGIVLIKIVFILEDEKKKVEEVVKKKKVEEDKKKIDEEKKKEEEVKKKVEEEVKKKVEEEVKNFIVFVGLRVSYNVGFK